MARTVLLATDGSEHARRAAERAVDLAAAREATLHVLCVVDRRVVDEPGLSSAETVTIAVEDRGHDCVAEVSRTADRAGVAVEGVHRHGVPHEVVLEYADEVDAETIVLGEHGDHAEHLGGVGRRIVEGTDREVLVVDAGSRDRDEVDAGRETGTSRGVE
jgi:nucleotide-binding universal stress UspA family protein